jgi:hypothetical protein
LVALLVIVIPNSPCGIPEIPSSSLVKFCSRPYNGTSSKRRKPHAFRSANAELLACDYAEDAVFMMPGTVVQGREQIQAVFAGFFQPAGAINALPVSSLTTDAHHALMLYSVDSQHVVVTGGVDTFRVVKGRIVAQTVYLGGLSPR